MTLNPQYALKARELDWSPWPNLWLLTCLVHAAPLTIEASTYAESRVLDLDTSPVDSRHMPKQSANPEKD